MPSHRDVLVDPRQAGQESDDDLPDYAFGYDHRDFFGQAVAKRGGTVLEKLAIPPTESSFTKYFARVPADTEVLYHVMVGPGVLTFVKEMGEHFGKKRPQIFGFIDSLEGVDIASPGLEFLDGTYFWEAFPRYAEGPRRRTRRATASSSASTIPVRARRIQGRVDVLAHVRLLGDAACHQAGSGKERLQGSDAWRLQEARRSPRVDDRLRRGTWASARAKSSTASCTSGYGHQYVSKVEGRRLKVVHRTKIEDSLYDPSGLHEAAALIRRKKGQDPFSDRRKMGPDPFLP